MCSVASRPMPGQVVSGDAFVCQPFDGGTLVCAIDGLGHGEEAACAANVAKEIMEARASDPLISLVRLCDAEMKHTRGAVASLARFDVRQQTLSWLGVGNVDGVFYRTGVDGSVAKEAMTLRGGVIGYMLPSLTVSTFEISVGDTLVFATDGLASGFTDHLRHDDELQRITCELLARYGKDNDDALVIAARYTGGEPA